MNLGSSTEDRGLLPTSPVMLPMYKIMPTSVHRPVKKYERNRVILNASYKVES